MKYVLGLISRVFFVSFCFVLLSCANEPSLSADAKTEGRVVAITDGDTFTLLAKDNRQIKVRLHGIDCPEKRQDFGQVAKQKLSDLIYMKEVSIVKKDKDRYGRTVALVYIHDTCINEEMLKQGLAWHYTKYDKNAAWSHLEEEARKARIGLWAQSEPTPPWEWRKRK